MAQWDEERRLILAQIEAEDSLDADELADMDRVLYACQEAIGDTLRADPIKAAAALTSVQTDGGNAHWLDAIDRAICAAPITDRERHAALSGAFQMARAFLWALGHADD